MAHDRLTRAEIATTTGISKPTISDSVQRLEQAGLVVDTGERTTGRGRAGSYYALAPRLGTALVASITPHGVVAQAVDARDRVHAEVRTDLRADAGEEVAGRALAAAAEELRDRLGGPPRLAVVSAADPVDRATGRLVHLPDAPFLVGALDPPAVLADTVTGPVLADNDVNWAARAEYDGGCVQGVADFVYLHLGEGLGCAVVGDGAVRRGHRGLVGRSPTCAPPAPTAGRCPSPRCSPRWTCAARAPPPSTWRNCARSSTAPAKRTDGSARPWPGPSAACCRPPSPSRTRRPSSSAAPGAPTPG